MLNYSEKELNIILNKVLNKRIIKITPVGNHHLKRHLVYKVDILNEQSLIFKLYYKKNKRDRELNSLKLLENSTVKLPRVVSYGTLENEDEWIICEFIEGEVFDRIKDKIPYDQQLKLFYQMGTELGKIHSYKTFDFFGDWNSPNKNLKDYSKYLVENMEQCFEEILKQKLPDENLLLQAIQLIRHSYNDLDKHILPTLIHNDFDGRNILVKQVNGQYDISAIIDFEMSMPGNIKNDLVALYYRYFLDNKDFERNFIKAYSSYLPIEEAFYKELNIELLKFLVGNCSWAYWQAPDYYKDNIEFLRRLLNKRF
ncbi:aminoglycoside phosphotransferase family protein [Desnuesiella massiliensis]|uniref:aminoglycoside phosphotransferase family protein n=1 Tax=Desnuesiella massiliensis TaxID=1650662 RepID=UPI0006E244FE|nr:aminoglycoside phosphotransferase family protein [Desnuesiella massiliensis]